MTQCTKCGSSRRVVTKVNKYWGRAFAWSIGSFAAMGFAWAMSADKEVDIYLKIVLWVLFLGTLMIAVRQWKKTFSGESYIQHECKICEHKWRDGYSR